MGGGAGRGFDGILATRYDGKRGAQPLVTRQKPVERTWEQILAFHDLRDERQISQLRAQVTLPDDVGLFHHENAFRGQRWTELAKEVFAEAEVDDLLPPDALDHAVETCGPRARRNGAMESRAAVSRVIVK